MSYDFAQLFINNEHLLKGESKISINESLNGKEVIGLYFSAHWCGPCRSFTPKLADAYNELIKLGKSFEVVFLSSDDSEEEFQEYYKEMPWLALPFSSNELKKQLSQKYECQGIPYLVLLDGNTGNIITKEGRSALQQHSPDGFPFKEADIERSKKEKIEKKALLFTDWQLFESSFEVSELKSKEAVAIFIGCGTGTSGVYVFNALLNTYKALQGKLAVVYVPSNVKDPENEQKFTEQMPQEWFKLKQNSEALLKIKSVLGAIDDPLTIILNGSGTEIYNDEASRIIYEQEQLGFPWSKEALEAEKKQKQEKINKFKESIKEGGLEFLESANIVSNIKDQKLNLDDLKSKELVGLYFSAHWCGPCRSFTPQFAEQYKQLKQDEKNVEVLFVSSDRDQASFNEYFAEMPWLALDYTQRDIKSLLSEGFQVNGIPCLIWVNPSTGEINKNGRTTISDYGAEYYPWSPELIKKAQEEMEEKQAKKKVEKQQKIKDIEQGWRDAKTVILKNHISPGGIVLKDYTLQFEKFNTFVADIKLTNGQFYYEVTVVKMGSAQQMGWITEGFYQPSDQYQGEGVGDDANSFGVDGDRVLSWYNGNKQFGQQWKEGDVIGFAFDTNSKQFTVSVNGNYDSPNGIVFQGDDIKCEIPWISPGLTAQSGQYQVNFGDKLFKFQPPSDSYKSVHQANLENIALYE